MVIRGTVCVAGIDTHSILHLWFFPPCQEAIPARSPDDTVNLASDQDPVDIFDFTCVRPQDLSLGASACGRLDFKV